MNNPTAFIKQFPKKKILVIGDLMLDEYIDGITDRISPEAPIPVLLQKSVRHCPGGAGNVAANVSALGAAVTLLGVVGKDAHANILKQLCRKEGIAPQFIIDESRPTTTKIRFVSDHHQLVRIDIEEVKTISSAIEAKLVKAIRELPKHDIVIISDYAKGCITKRILKTLRARFGAGSIIADMKPINASLYSGIFAITPNIKEASALTSIHASTDALAERVTKILANRLNTSVVLTRGESGVTVRQKGARKSAHFPSTILTVRDVTGAGDTLVAAFALMCATGAPLLLAGELANYAAGIVVGVGGTHALPRKTLEEHLASGKHAGHQRN